MAPAENFLISYATCSIGFNTNFSLLEKLQAIADAGFQGIELSFPDLLQFTKEKLNRDVEDKGYEYICAGAEAIRGKCNELGVKIMMLQPFSNFEGWPGGSNERKEVFEKAKGWIQIMQHAGIEMLQVCERPHPDLWIGENLTY